MGAATRNAPLPLRVVAGTQAAPAPRGTTTPVPITSAAQLSQVPAQVNLAAYSGDDFSFTLTATNPDQSPVDFTGAVILAQIRPKPDAAITAVFTTTVAANVITLSLDHTTSQPLAGVFVWDCQITYTSGKVHTLAAGVFSITADVSHTP
jgi:hypothetical protein